MNDMTLTVETARFQANQPVEVSQIWIDSDAIAVVGPTLALRLPATVFSLAAE